MTINKLHKLLSQMVEAGCGRIKVCIDKDSFWDGNGTFQICEVRSMDSVFVAEVDGDGFHIENRDGSERGRARLVLSGESAKAKVQP